MSKLVWFSLFDQMPWTGFLFSLLALWTQCYISSSIFEGFLPYFRIQKVSIKMRWHSTSISNSVSRLFTNLTLVKNCRRYQTLHIFVIPWIFRCKWIIFGHFRLISVLKRLFDCICCVEHMFAQFRARRTFELCIPIGRFCYDLVSRVSPAS